jgi:transmembrane sensor
MQKSSYRHCSEVDLIRDEAFIRWVREGQEADHRFWKVFLQHHPDRRPVVDGARAQVQQLLGEAGHAPLGERGQQALWQRIEHQMEQEALTRRSLRRPWLWTSTAAAVALLVLWFNPYWISPEPEMIRHEVTDGKPQTVQLPDGSRVVLNSHSCLRYAQNWADRSQREVWLEGEAYFEVEKSPARQPKFVVHTPLLDAAVLGTRFNVRHRRQQTEVVLAEGAMDILIKEGETPGRLTLKPGEAITYNGQKAELVHEAVVFPEYAYSWKDGLLMFEEKTVKELAELVADMYGIEVKVGAEDGLKTRQIRGGIPTHDFTATQEVLNTWFQTHWDPKAQRLTIENP